jgi:CRISPR-associated exonuclease Cas4
MDPVVPIAALEHHVYCPRQCALIHVDGVWDDNPHTVRGIAGHARVDSGASRRERGVTVLRSVPLWSEALGLSGRSDAIEVSIRGDVTPVEYKMGARHGDASDVQLCAQALCLEEMLDRPVPHGYLWVSAHRRRLRVVFDAQLRELTTRIITEVRCWLTSSALPPAVNDARCPGCQLLDHCQPEMSSRPDAVMQYLREVVMCAS